jgi:hypothetical protein
MIFRIPCSPFSSKTLFQGLASFLYSLHLPFNIILFFEAEKRKKHEIERK